MIELKVRKLLHFSNGNHELEVDVRIEKGKFLSVYGNSGAGKTTLLRMLAGLTSPDSGTIVANNHVWFNDQHKINIKPQARNTGFVFQDFALFPNMTVRENLTYALAIKKDISIVSELLETTGLKELANRPTFSLSGGQQQRVALARALVRRPNLLLLDEPLSALDHETRVRLQDEILRIHKHYQLTTVLISHDKDEIIKLSDRVVQLEQGRVILEGAPGDLFSIQDENREPVLQGSVAQITPGNALTELEIISGGLVNKIIVDSAKANHLRVGDQVVIYGTERDISRP